MKRNLFARNLLAVWTGAAFTLAAGPLAAQLGHVVKAQKISATSGGFTAQLEEMDQFGRSIVNLGDLDGDGVSDLLVGAHTDDDGGLDQGSVYVLFLHPNGFVKSWQKISDLEGNFGGHLDKGDQFGRAAANLGDLDGDGVVDVAVSSNYDDDGGTNKGAVYVLFLNTDGTVKASQKISSTTGGLPVTMNLHDEFGRSLTCLGDLDGDGVVDLLVGTPEDDEGGTNTGAMHVLFLNPNGTVKGYHRISKFTEGLAIKPGDWFGFCSANLGDFDGDGVVDVAVGAVLDDDGGVNQGSCWILFMNPDGSVKESHEIDELEGGFVPLDDIDQFGTSVTSLGDLDGDGVTDIAVGAVKDDDGGQPGNPDADVGATYVLFLTPQATVKQVVKLSDITGDLPYALDQYDWFGSALARLDGSSGDGLFNVAIGCRNDDDAGGNQGAIYLVQLNDGTAPVSSFLASRTTGVAPMSVTFTDTSEGEVTGWVWAFGDGPQSNLQHPVKTYTTPGTYDVQLTTRGPKGTDVLLVRDLVTVVPGPLALFDAAPRAGACPLTVTFAQLSEGDVTSWSWDFGDGQTSSEPAPVHVYQECGTYTVSLTVTGPDGSHTLSQDGYVVAAIQAPEAAFEATLTSGPAPLDVQFTDRTTGLVTGWSWDFGDGTSASEPNPLHRYESVGVYTVSLTASGPGGSDVVTWVDLVSATVPPPTAYFDATPTLGPGPLAVSFSDLTTGAVLAWSWDFGDGASSSEPSPVHVYTVPGTYSVTLTATGPGGQDVRTRPDLITVESPPPGAAFDASPTSGNAPLTVQFTDLSSVLATSWSWDFGDGAGESTANPEHVYAQPGLYTVALTVGGPDGVHSVTRADLVSVQAPPTLADFGAAPVSGVVPLAVVFQDLSTPDVTGWSWAFGDGASSTEASPTHTYTVPGTYGVTLAVTSPSGGDTRTRAGLVTVSEPAPVAAFALAPVLGVAPLEVTFEDRSSGVVTSWSWDFGDGESSRASAPSHVYSAPGAYSVALTVSGPGGTDTLTLAGAVEVLAPAPLAQFGAAPTSGVAPLTVQFTDASSGLVDAWAWDFGDGTSSTLPSPGHVYTTPGTYTVTLTASGPGGSDADTKPALVTVGHAAPVAAIGAAPTSGEAPLTVQFADVSSGTVTAWVWDFGDGLGSSDEDPAHVYTTPGTYTVTLTVTGPGGSDLESLAGLVTVSTVPPFADFSLSPREGYAPLQVAFTDLSTGAIDTHSWNFGDGQVSALASPVHVFLLPGTFSVTLDVTGPGGTSQRRRSVVVRPAPIFADGGFELQVAGLAPGAPWNVFNGSNHRVRGASSGADGGFASEGQQWCDLGAEGSSSARPASNPLGQGTPPTGASGIQQDFVFPVAAPHLFFEAAFLLDGVQDSPSRNDFMSVDLSDGVTFWNVFHADSFSTFTRTSALHGFAMTDTQRVHVDLARLFPAATETTVLSLRVSLGNVGGATGPSRGYVDGLRFHPAALATFRNGLGINPGFYACSPAVLGGVWTVDIDSSLKPDTRLAVVAGFTQAHAGFPLYGGEGLVAGSMLFSLNLPTTGASDHFVVPIPDNPALIGITLTTQAVLVGQRFMLGNAYDLTMGY
jgi:PKD repeat protein